MKDELASKIMIEFAALRRKTSSHITDDDDKNKKTKRTKKCALKRKLKFKDYKHYFKGTENKINYL